jgi:hypothetical protein
MEAVSNPMKNIRKWPAEIMKYIPSKVLRVIRRILLLDGGVFTCQPFVCNRKTRRVPILSTDLTMVIIGT